MLSSLVVIEGEVKHRDEQIRMRERERDIDDDDDEIGHNERIKKKCEEKYFDKYDKKRTDLKSLRK